MYMKGNFLWDLMVVVCFTIAGLYSFMLDNKFKAKFYMVFNRFY